MIKAIIIDYGGVLGSNSNEFNTTFKFVIKESGLSLVEVQKIWKTYWPKLKRNKITTYAFWNKIYKKSKLKLHKGTLEKKYKQKMNANNNLLKFIVHLKDKYRLFIMTNEAKDWMNIKIQNFNLKKYFEKIYCSCYFGTPKPFKKFFRYIIKDIEIKPDEIIFIDDKEKNIIVAQSFGMKTIQYKNIQNLKKSFLIFN